ncbi:MAG: carboxypeptidase-like regulatory domain-containing protein [Pyrinomonadaceae bacterium]
MNKKLVFLFSILLFVLSGTAVIPQTSASDAAKDAADRVRAGADKAADSNQQAEEPTVRIKGRVFYEDTGLPLRRSWIGLVKVSLLAPPPDGGDQNIRRSSWEFQNPEAVLTDDSGNFELSGVTPGVYQAVLKVPGIFNPTAEDRDNPQFKKFIIDGTPGMEIDVPVKRGGAISGIVTYQDGAPLIGAAVRLMKSVRNDAGAETLLPAETLGYTTTDDRGYYRIAGLPDGDYVVVTSEPSVFDGSSSPVSSYSTSNYYDTSELKTFYPSAKTPAEASRIPVFLGAEAENTDIVLSSRQLFEASGLVVDGTSNKLIDDIEIYFRREGEDETNDYQASQIKKTVTDAEGRWRLKDLLPGKYIVRIGEASYKRYREEGAVVTRPNYATTERNFEVAQGENRDIIFRIASEGKISGTISTEGNQLLPASVTINADTKTGRASNDSVETIDYDGDEPRSKAKSDFLIEDLSEGEYYISVDADEGFFAKSITLNGRDIADTPVKVKFGEELKGLKVVLSSGYGTLAGTVKGMDPSKYYNVYMMPVRQDAPLFRSFLRSSTEYLASSGEYEAKVRPGEYYVFVVEGYGAAPTGKTPEFLEEWVGGLIQNAKRVNIARGATTNLDLEIEEGQ